MTLTLEGLQEALRKDALERQEQSQMEEEHSQKTRTLRKSIETYCRSSSHHWIRPLPDSLFRCPLSAPQTTLMPWNSLPQTLQTKLSHLKPENPASIVEVPLVYLSVDLDSGQESTSLLRHHRPLGGNLTTKLSEYTRGIAGQARPFRPGGADQDEEEENNNNNQVVADDKTQDPATLEQAVEASRRVLQQSSQQSWEEGILLTAPPGMTDFKVGLSYADLYGGSNDDKPAAETATRSIEEKQQPPNVSSSSQLPRRQVSENMFSRSFFDDDSLFGSSSSSSDDDDNDDSSDEEGDSENDRDAVQVDKDEVKEIALKDPDAGPETPKEEEEDVDQLLQELTLTDDNIFRKKIAATDNENPLQLAERHAQDQHNSTRKMWATTKLLPIRDFNTYIPNPAMTFPFQLDDFQQQAIARLERSESVFVAAHTSAGKTVVAEYSIALARQRATRCVYTSPIKALSNQKFRDFSLKYGAENVGLVTGDLQVNVDDSTVLIMTTEILRSMLYRGADLIRDIEFVIFDEVHYINDSERGVVWEEVIIMLPSYVNLIFLSATTPNTLEFSDWIGRTKRKPVYVVKTDYRPVPLSHNLWAGGKLHKVMEGNGAFMEKGYAEATRALLPASARDTGTKSDPKAKAKVAPRPQTGSKQLAWQQQGTKQNWMSLVRYLDREILTPACIFSFSKKKCEEIANMLRSLDLNTAKERSAVQAFSLQTVARLSKNDSKLPQVMTICEMATRGICVHHGGLLPILKEMVEILFSRNLIKVLLCTETFAIGVNMPCKCVVFNSLRKHDGTQFRNLEPGEYTQMAGRAGRRMIDKVGTVIICCFGEQPPPNQMLRTILTGRSTTLRSQFRLTYNMILNLLRVEEMSVEAMIKRSFSEFATQRALTKNEYPKLLARGTRTLEKIENQLRADADNRVGVEDIEDYYNVCKLLLDTNKDILEYIQETEHGLFTDDFLQPGRVILLSAARQFGVVRAPAIVLRSKLPQSNASFGISHRSTGETTSSQLVCLVLMPPSYVKKDVQTSPGTIGFIGASRQRCYTICEIDLGQILVVSKLKQKVDAKVLLKDESKSRGHPGISSTNEFFKKPGRSRVSDPFSGMMSLGKKKNDGPSQLGSSAAKENQMIDEVIDFLLKAEQAELRDMDLPLIDTQAYVKRGNDAVRYRQACENIVELTTRMRSFTSHRHPNLERWYKEVERRESLREKVDTLQHLLSNESLQLFPDFLQRKAVLRNLGYVDENETVCVKGRVACEVNTCEELIVTEMVFEGILNDMEPEEIVAVLSSLVYQEKKDEELSAELPQRLVDCCEEMMTIARNLGQLQKEQGLDVDPAEYCEKSLKFGLVHVVYEWALGVPFKNICELTDVQEGSIVRCITRLDELCREVRNCARVVGNPTLYRKLEAASTAIKRDIVFASSLYVS